MAHTFKHPMLAFRIAHDLSQADAAAMVGITSAMWSRIELGDGYASPALAQRISRLTGIAMGRLMNFSDNEPVGGFRDDTNDVA